MAHKVNQHYQDQITQIFIDGEQYADKQMKTVYQKQKDYLDELHKYVGFLYITYALNGLIKVNPTQKISIIKTVENKLKSISKEIGNTEIKTITDILEYNYADAYYKNAYVMDSGIKVKLKFGLLKKEYIDRAVNNPIDGELFSDRIWANKADVADAVKKGIVNALHGDTTIDQLAKQISQTFNAQASDSQRLVSTENSRVQSQAIDDIGKSTGCTEQLYCATLEGNTCSECRHDDGRYFSIDDTGKPSIPRHARCRCLYINVPPTEWIPAKRRDNESKTTIDYQAYNEWAQNKSIKY